jgi:predicted RecA/RadA family phage recombinase
MKNFIQEGDTLTLVAPYDVVSGAGLLVGAIFAIASYSVVSGTNVEGATEGVFDLAKATGQAWTQGQKIYWDNTNKVCTTTASGNTLIGAATQAAASGDTVGRVYLTGQVS